MVSLWSQPGYSLTVNLSDMAGRWVQYVLDAAVSSMCQKLDTKVNVVFPFLCILTLM